MKDSPGESILPYIQSILSHYDLPPVFELLSKPPPPTPIQGGLETYT